MGQTYPHARLGQVRPHGDLLPGRHVRIAISAERLLQLVQLLRGEVGPLAALPLVLLVVLRAIDTVLLDGGTAGRPRTTAGAVLVRQHAAQAFRLYRRLADAAGYCREEKEEEKEEEVVEETKETTNQL